MMFLELLAVLATMTAWAERIKGKCVLLRVDNIGAGAAIDRGSMSKVKSDVCRLLLLEIGCLAAELGVTLRWRWVKSAENKEADMLSRLLPWPGATTPCTSVLEFAQKIYDEFNR